MQNLAFPSGAAPSALPTSIRLAVASSSARPPEGDDWLHEVKYDGHRIVAILDRRGGLKLITRNGHERTPVFRAPFRELLSCRREIVLDGEIAVPDDRGVTHIGDLHDAIAERSADRLAYFAFDLVYLDGHDLRRCPIEERKALLRQVLDDVRCPRLVYVDHIIGHGADLFEHVRAIGAEGIVSKRAGSRYSGGTTRDWRKTKCHATGQFVVTGFQELGPGRLEALHVAEERDGRIVAAGQVRFGFAGKGLWATLDQLRLGSTDRLGIVRIEPVLVVQVKYFGRHKGGAIPRWRARRSRSVADPSGRIAVVVRHRPGDRGDGRRCACRARLATLRVLQPAFPNVVYPQYRLGMRAGAREGGGM